MLLDIFRFLRRKIRRIIVAFFVLFFSFFLFQYVMDHQAPKLLEENVGIDGYRLLRCDIDSVVKNDAGEVLLYDFSDLWKRPTLMSEFADTLSAKYDMSIIYEDWDKMVIGNQVNKLRDNIETTKIGNLLYELRYYNEVPVSDKEIVTELVNNMLDDYIDYIKKYTKFSDPNVKFEVVKEHTYIRTELKGQFNKTENLILKEVTLSFAGSFLITLFLSLLLYMCSLMKNKHQL